LRANAGSSITQPYPSIVSGFGSITVPNAAQANYVNSIPNFDLKPETTVGYDVGLDQRLPDGGVVSADLYDITVHDVFLSNTTNLGTITNLCGPGNGVNPNAQCLQTNYINGPIQRGYGVELSATKIPVVGFGYYLSGTVSRTYLDQLPLSIYFSNTTAANGNFNISGEQLFGYPFLKAYGSLLYTDRHGNLYEIGADYEGKNNFTFGPEYTVYDAAVRIPIIAKKLRFSVSAQNLFGYNDGTALGRALYNQGNVEPTVYYNSAKHELLPGNSAVYNRNGTTSINALPPETIRFGFDLAL
jgi:outer membrane receptor protein involved in Fe transport